MKNGRRSKAAESVKDAKIAKLEAVVAQKEAKIAQKNEVISELMEETRLDDLAILCANCHRAIHRLGPEMPSVEELAAQLRAEGKCSPW